MDPLSLCEGKSRNKIVWSRNSLQQFRDVLVELVTTFNLGGVDEFYNNIDKAVLAFICGCF